MRTYGRTYDEFGVPTWVEVMTDAQGFNDAVYLTTLVQTLKLNLGEAPFNADYGIPAQQSVITQLFPDFYVARTQSQFAPYFASLIVSKVPDSTRPTYNVNVVTHQGVRITWDIPT